MMLLLTTVLLLGFDPNIIGVEQLAFREARREVLLIDGISLERPYLALLMRTEEFLEFEEARSDEILRFTTRPQYICSIVQHGEVLGTICVYPTTSGMKICGRSEEPSGNPWYDFLELRDRLAPDRQLVSVSIMNAAYFAISHKNFVAEDVYPISPDAWEMLTGLRPKKWAVGERQPIGTAAPKIKKVVRVWLDQEKAHLEKYKKENGNQLSN